jgi:hypothetical protein
MAAWIWAWRSLVVVADLSSMIENPLRWAPNDVLEFAG